MTLLPSVFVLPESLIQETAAPCEGTSVAPDDDLLLFRPSCLSSEWSVNLDTGEFLSFCGCKEPQATKSQQIDASRKRTLPPGFTKGLFAEAVGDEIISPVMESDEVVIGEQFESPRVLSGAEVDAYMTDDDPNQFKFVYHSARFEVSKTQTHASEKTWAHSVDTNKLPLDYAQVVPELAFPYPFELDLFQKQAVYFLERGQSVFVAAHTSAGKTVVAEYAIALAQQHLTKAIYTSPIKALSNQKFRDFRETFEDVGLLTGDVQINPDASCVIMTTEILRSMLYRGAEAIRDVEYVIFDEVHYVNDVERGVVWEEVIIMLPPSVRLILLSATTPNTFEFADWVGRTRQQPVFVISTLYRPVPLEHYLYFKREMTKIVDAGRSWQDTGLKSALVKQANCERHVGGRNEHTLWVELAYFLQKRSLLPAVFFTFSRRRCEEYADALSALDLNTASEKSAVHIFLATSTAKLTASDAQLPQIARMAEMLQRGVAVHHSGLLPLMKEAVEILFSRGLVKILFATETFAMGVNMPARTVVFTGIKKHDGQSFRVLLPGEYTQMAGRAGRRGKDTTGTVIIAVTDEQTPSELALKQLILGTPTRLVSQFRLTYRMLLNLLRVESMRVEDVIRKSFSENTAQKMLPDEERRMTEVRTLLDSTPELHCPTCLSDCGAVMEQAVEYLAAGHFLFRRILKEPGRSRLFVLGRLMIVNVGALNTLAVCLKTVIDRDGHGRVIVLTESSESEGQIPWPAKTLSIPAATSQFILRRIRAEDIVCVCRDRLTIGWSSQSRDEPNQREVTEITGLLREAILQGKVNFEEEPIPEFKLLEYDEQRLKRQDRSDFTHFHAVQCLQFPEHYPVFVCRATLSERLAEMQFRVSEGNLALLPEYHARLAVMRHLGFIDPVTGTVQLKGRVACELNSVDELLTTELLFGNFFGGDKTPADIVALLSCMVFQERVDDDLDASVPEHLLPCVETIVSQSERLGSLQREYGVPTPAEQMAGQLRFGLVNVIYLWALGHPFTSIITTTDVLEGSIVRCVVRLDETCREVRNAARIMGDMALAEKMEQASIAIKRDICFASSLYL